MIATLGLTLTWPDVLVIAAVAVVTYALMGALRR